MPTDSAAAVRVVLVDRANAIGAELGPAPRPHIPAALDELGIDVHRLDQAGSGTGEVGGEGVGGVEHGDGFVGGYGVASAG